MARLAGGVRKYWPYASTPIGANVTLAASVRILDSNKL